MGLEANRRLGVDEVGGCGGAPPGDPVEGALERGGPGGGEDGEGVVLGGEALDAVVLAVVGHDPVDKVEEVAEVVGGGGGSGG